MAEAGPDVDLVVVGGGTAGIVAARTATSLGARAALVERARTGGDCLWTGCVPSKALLSAAHRIADTRNGKAFGLRVADATVDFAAVMRHVVGAITAIEPEDSPTALEAAGVRVILAAARFTGPASLQVDGRLMTFRRALVATGATPTVPPLPGLRESRPLTSETVWGLDALPDRLAVLGGGSIGCELAQAFARLGSQVTVVEAMPRLLAREDPDAAALVHAALQADGVKILAGHRVTTVRGAPGGPGEVVVSGSSFEAVVGYDRLLVAVGRSPTSAGLGLDAAGIEVDDRGFVVVDATLRTTNRRVWAAGDVTALSAFTHTAGVHASIAATNAVLGLRRRVDLSAVPRVTYTHPEVAAVGRATWDEDDGPAVRTATRRHGPALRTVTRRHDRVDRAVADANVEGFTRLALGRRATIVGATVVGPRAGETLAELTLAVRTGLTTRDIAATTHPYPTYGDGPWNAAIDDVRARLATPTIRRVTGGLVRLRRALTSRGVS